MNMHFDLKTPDGACDTFAAYPSEGGPFPGVLFLMDGVGPRDTLYEMVKTLASHGYYVLLPNLMYRAKRAPLTDLKFPLAKDGWPELRKQLAPFFQTYSPELGVKDIGVFLDFLSKQKEVRKGPVGVTGYCLGGGLALRAAAHYPDRVAAAASFHGGNLASDAPNSPHLLLDRVKCELYIGNADNAPPCRPSRSSASAGRWSARA